MRELHTLADAYYRSGGILAYTFPAEQATHADKPEAMVTVPTAQPAQLDAPANE